MMTGNEAKKALFKIPTLRTLLKEYAKTTGEAKANYAYTISQIGLILTEISNCKLGKIDNNMIDSIFDYLNENE